MKGLALGMAALLLAACEKYLSGRLQLIGGAVGGYVYNGGIYCLS